MTSIPSSQRLELQLTPMLLPEAFMTAATQDNGKNQTEPNLASDRTDLLLHPGETSEMVLQLKNTTDRPLPLEIEVRGNFPASWCRWHLEGQEIRPHEEMLVGIYFEVPADFFESQEFNRDRQLEYQSTVRIYYLEQEDRRRLIETTGFYLYIRSRSLYLDYLPALYREVDFVGRLLQIFEQTFEPSVHTLNALWAYLDPLTAPKSLLPFLAYWVGWELIPEIDLPRQRYLIRHAVQIYCWRGTKRGLRLYLHLSTGLPLDEDLPENEKSISIEEPFASGFVLDRACLGQDTILGGGKAYHFIVRLRPITGQPLEISSIRKIIEREKPIWCTYELYIEERAA
ncbi:MAG: phage tail protein [Prochloraceae cyanobacterium]